MNSSYCAEPNESSRRLIDFCRRRCGGDGTRAVFYWSSGRQLCGGEPTLLFRSRGLQLDDLVDDCLDLGRKRLLHDPRPV